MNYKEELGKAILDVSDTKPKDFNDKIGAIVADKLKTALSNAVKAEEANIFKKHK